MSQYVIKMMFRNQNRNNITELFFLNNYADFNERVIELTYPKDIILQMESALREDHGADEKYSYLTTEVLTYKQYKQYFKEKYAQFLSNKDRNKLSEENYV